MFCRNCGAPADEGAQFCIRCGASFAPVAEAEPSALPPSAEGAPLLPGPDQAVLVVREQKQKLLAAVLAFVLGWLGIHRFYLGYTVIGVLQAVLGVLGIFTCGLTTFAAAVWGIIDGVMILTGAIKTDAQGIPLRD